MVKLTDNQRFNGHKTVTKWSQMVTKNRFFDVFLVLEIIDMSLVNIILEVTLQSAQLFLVL